MAEVTANYWNTTTTNPATGEFEFAGIRQTDVLPESPTTREDWQAMVLSYVGSLTNSFTHVWLRWQSNGTAATVVCGSEDFPSAVTFRVDSLKGEFMHSGHCYWRQYA